MSQTVKTETYFAVSYRYYQYNDGRANNGNFEDEIRCLDEANAIALAKCMNEAAKRHMEPALDISPEDEELDQALVGRYIGGLCGGYFESAEAFKVEVTRTALPTMQTEPA